MEIPLEKFFQIFSHGRLAAFDGMANGALVHALLPGDLAVAFAEDQMRLYPDALHLRQRIEGVPQVDEQLHTIQKLLRRRLMQAGRVFDPIVTVEGILRLVAGRAPLMGCLIQLVRLQLGGHFVGNFDVFIMGVPSVKVLQIDGGNVKKCAVGKHPKSEKHGNTAQFSEVERSGTQENCGGIGSGCRLRLHPLPVLRRRQSHRVACIDPDAVVVDKNIAKNDRFDLFSR